MMQKFHKMEIGTIFLCETENTKEPLICIKINRDSCFTEYHTMLYIDKDCSFPVYEGESFKEAIQEAWNKLTEIVATIKPTLKKKGLI